MNTTGNYITNQGDLTLEQIGENVNGKYSKTGVLEGSISGNVITGIWKNSGKEGLFAFVFSDDLSFKGKYKIGTEHGIMRSKWDGHTTNLNNTEESKNKTNEEKNDVKTVFEKKNGTTKWVDDEGNIFDGTWENDILIKGIITYHDGSVEEGEFNEEELNGKGKCSYKDDDGELIVEEGEFNDGILIKGTIIWEDGTRKEGEFNEDGILIKGTITYHDGSVEEGVFNEDGLNGKGKWINGRPVNINSPDIAEEEIKLIIGENIKKMGKSTVIELFRNYFTHLKSGNELYDLSKSEVIKLLELNLEACLAFYDWKALERPESILHKKMSDLLPKKTPPKPPKSENGDIYEGEFKDGKFHGAGTLKYKNGDFYEGEFKDGVRHGTGIFYDKKNDSVRDGKWFFDKPVLSETEKKLEEKKRNERLKANQAYFKQLEKEREKEEKEREKEEKEREKKEKEGEKNKVRKFKIRYTYVKDGSSTKWDEYTFANHRGQTMTESQARTYVKSQDYFISRGKGKLIGIKSIEEE